MSKCAVIWFYVYNIYSNVWADWLDMLVRGPPPTQSQYIHIIHQLHPLLPFMDEWAIKTPNPKCRLFYKIDLWTNFAALCLTDFIDWRYIHSWLVFCPSLCTVAPMDEGTILLYCCPSPLPSLWPSPHPSPPFQTKGGGRGNVELCCRPYSAGVLHSVSD
jgi:hypothetical protein